ncbi:L-threonine 3-dehydrogenase [Gemella sp. GH3]|uniref:L-threonine 3-dehydrogenase n=1 Tax=unclassified Gemella TaxID=2624949 RepID=UPI0015D09AD6|nr:MULTISPECIES: L-threonine 3-dehydrogenase [unclassified Gemella]MBF0714087.1 L-threonine 3-dehydrogenase [Gemella sp. GH3.1]NYS51039.1 L-threonine 3-dehydrogenase [Gemella sp. GH3]
MKKVLVTGALGQIGSELVLRLRKDLGVDNVVATDIKRIEDNEVVTDGVFEILDVMDYNKFLQLAKDSNVDTIIHLAALLSATAEKNPQLGWSLNMQGLVNGLEVARELDAKFFAPSSIAAFGNDTPKDNTPQDTLMRPSTMYGVTKVAGELLCDYYHTKYGLDTRSVRFPGLISHKVLPGGGTTDYAVHIYYDALKYGKYTSFIAEGTYMDMMYMDDAIDAVVDLLNADSSKLKHRNSFNIAAMSFEPEQIAASIRKYIPNFEMDYDVDPVRQGIANSWPNSIDSTCATEEWGFEPKFDLDKMTKTMLDELSKKEI